jgi:UDPglucose 6-dehydrogenase
MKARMGDGGGCHPRDNIALRHMAQNLNLGYDLFDSIMNAREIQAKNIAIKLVDLVREHNLHKIFIHGKSYKPGVEYCDGSYSLLVGHYLRELEYEPTYIDPMTESEVYQPLTPAVFLLAHSASTTYKYTQQHSVDSLYCEIPAGSIVLDPWRNYVNDKCTVIHYGNTRQK